MADLTSQQQVKKKFPKAYCKDGEWVIPGFWIVSGPVSMRPPFLHGRISLTVHTEEEAWDDALRQIKNGTTTNPK
jgi:hypothetical protein